MAAIYPAKLSRRMLWPVSGTCAMESSALSVCASCACSGEMITPRETSPVISSAGMRSARTAARQSGASCSMYSSTCGRTCRLATDQGCSSASDQAGLLAWPLAMSASCVS